MGTRGWSPILFGLALTTACGASGSPAATSPPPGPAATPWPSGTFAVRTQLDAATAGVFGARLSASLALLADLDAHPGHALLTLAEVQGLPAVAKLRKIPGLGGKLEGYLDDAVRRDAPAGTGRVAGLVTDLLELTRVVELGSTLTVVAGADGPTATHALGSVAFTLDDRRLAVPVPATATELVAPTTPSLQTDGAALVLGRHTFAVPYGAMLLEAAGPLLFAPRGGATLQAALAAMIGCPEVAARLGGTCQLMTCVRDAVPEATLVEVCDRAVAALAHQVEAMIAAQRLDVLALERGQATVAAGAPITFAGAWTVRIEADDAVVTGTAPFTATRTDDGDAAPAPTPLAAAPLTIAPAVAPAVR